MEESFKVHHCQSGGALHVGVLFVLCQFPNSDPRGTKTSPWPDMVDQILCHFHCRDSTGI